MADLLKCLQGEGLQGRNSGYLEVEHGVASACGS